MTHDHELARNPLAKGQVLLISTSSATLSSSGAPTGAWLSELAVPYQLFSLAGYDITIASCAGGAVPVDPASLQQASEPEVSSFQANEAAQQMMKASVPLSKVTSAAPYSALFLAGGHGASNDFPSCAPLQSLVKEALTNDQPVAALCHGNAAFASEELGKMVAGRRMAVFSDQEEEGVGRMNEVPFLLERRLKELGAHVEPGPPGQETVIVDGNLLTGQNPASAARLARETITAMQQRAAHVAAPDGVPVSPTSAGMRSPGTFTAGEAPALMGVAPLLHPPMATSEADVQAALEQAGGVTEPGTVDNLGQSAFPNPGTNAGNEAGASA